MSRLLVATIVRALIPAIGTSASAQVEEKFSLDTGPEGERGGLGWDADLTGRIGVPWKFVEQWSLSAELSHDVSAFQMGVDDTVFTIQLRWIF